MDLATGGSGVRWDGRDWDRAEAHRDGATRGGEGGGGVGVGQLRIMLPMMPPTVPAAASVARESPVVWLARYGARAWARLGSGMDWSQIWPGPVSATRW